MSQLLTIETFSVAKPASNVTGHSFARVHPELGAAVASHSQAKSATKYSFGSVYILIFDTASAHADDDISHRRT